MGDVMQWRLSVAAPILLHVFVHFIACEGSILSESDILNTLEHDSITIAACIACLHCLFNAYNYVK